MTVSTTGNRVAYAGNDVTLAFSFPNLFLADTDLVVLLVTDATGVSVTQVLNTDYTVTGATNPAGGTVTMVVAPAAGKTLVIYRDPPLTQGVDTVPNDPLPVETAVEAPLDKLTLLEQRSRELIERSLRLPDSDSGFTAADLQLPVKQDRASMFLAFDGNGKPIAATGTSANLGPVSTFINALLDDADETAAAATLGLSDTSSAAKGDALIGVKNSGSNSVSRTQHGVNEEIPSVLDFIPVAEHAAIIAGSSTTDLTSYFTNAVAAGKGFRMPAGTYLGVLSVRKNNFRIEGAGSSVVTIKHPAGATNNVLELGDTASGNSATAYSGITLRGFTIDGNRANVTAPTTDLVGHGIPLTKISAYHISDVRVKDCHNAGVGVFIDSNDGYADVYVENCGNATHTGPGFDVNSSKRNTFFVRSKNCYDGGRLLDNCFGNHVFISVDTATANGLIYSNQNQNESHGNYINGIVRTTGGHGVNIGPNCRHSTLDFNVSEAGDRGLSMAVQAITTKTFDGSSGAVVSTANETIAIAGHGWLVGTKVLYSSGGGTAIGGLAEGGEYYVIFVDANTIKLATTWANATAGSPINLTALGAGVSHTLTSDYNAVGNTIRLVTRRSTNQGVFLGGNDNHLNVISYLDGRGGAVGDNFAIDINGDRNKILANVVDSSPWKVRGIAIRSGSDDNEIVGYEYTNTLDPINDAGTRTRFNHGQGLSADIASAAEIDLLPLRGDTYTITGTTSITSIVARTKRKVTLIFAGALTFTDGSNLKLAGNFATSADDTITLVCDGTNWFEISRSAN